MSIIATRRAFGNSPLVTLAAILFLVGSASQASPQLTIPSSALQSELDDLLRLGVPGSLALVKEGARISTAASGVADLTTKMPVSIDHTWRIASVTKMATAIVVLQLAREGKLRIEDRLSRYLPGIVPSAHRITIGHLLNHTSGIPDYLYGRSFSTAKRLRAQLDLPQTFAAMIRAANAQPRRFAPGARHDYSNSNYVLLGRIVEIVSGKTFSEVVSERIIRKLQLKNTGFPDMQGKFPEPHLSAYIPGDLFQQPFANYADLKNVTVHRRLLGADGGLYSNAIDLAKFLDALWDGQLLTQDERDEMMKHSMLDHEGRYRYGYGISIYRLSCGKTIVGHEGSDLGNYTLVVTEPKTSRHLVLTVNMAIHRRPDVETLIERIKMKVFCGDKENQRHG